MPCPVDIHTGYGLTVTASAMTSTTGRSAPNPQCLHKQWKRPANLRKDRAFSV
jgi:hypothetical protein